MDQEQAALLIATMETSNKLARLMIAQQEQNNKQLHRIADSLSRLVQIEQWHYQYTKKWGLVRIHKHTYCIEHLLTIDKSWERIYPGVFPEHQFPDARPDI